MFCSKCGTENSETASFCSKCGTQLNVFKEIKQEEKKSRIGLVGAIVSLTAAFLSICPLMFDIVIATFAYNTPEINDQAWATTLSDTSLFRIGLALLVVILSIVSLVMKRTSKVISIITLISILFAIFMPQIFRIKQSVGGGIGLIFLLLALVGSIMLVIDSLKKEKST